MGEILQRYGSAANVGVLSRYLPRCADWLSFMDGAAWDADPFGSACLAGLAGPLVAVGSSRRWDCWRRLFL